MIVGCWCRDVDIWLWLWVDVKSKVSKDGWICWFFEDFLYLVFWFGERGLGGEY